MISLILFFQLPPLTPGINKKFGLLLKDTFSSWTQICKDKNIPKDPRSWTIDHVREWLSWAMLDFDFKLAPETFTKFLNDFKVRLSLAMIWVIIFELMLMNLKVEIQGGQSV